MQGSEYAIACATGSAALEIALKAVGVGPEDEVVVPPYTFVATATAPLLLNAIPVFCDIDPDTYNLDPQKLEAAITPRTKAIIPVHFAGLAADMDAILSIARQRGIAVIEDAAHAHGARWNDQGLGCFGDAGTFSFQASKNMTAGEGGLITMRAPDIAALCESYVWAGREQGRAWYEHFRLGWNYRLTEFQAALLLAQLQRLPEQNARRMANARYLNHALRDIPGIAPLQWPSYATVHSFHIYILRFREEEFGISRSLFISALNSEGIPCSSGYAHPLYKNELFLQREFTARSGLAPSHPAESRDYRAFESACPQAERACSEAVWFEHRLLLTQKNEIDDVVRAIRKLYALREEFSRPSSFFAMRK
jgi:dTDP-4-amino-4,6-dideoxygalactose transaminase